MNTSLPRVLILYATNSGNTYYVAHRIAEELENALKKRKIPVTVQSVGDVAPDILDEFDTIILGSCTWNRHTATAKYEEGQLQDQMQKFVDEFKKKRLSTKKFAVFGLGDSDYMKFCAAADHLEKFIADIHGAKIGETLRIDSFPHGQEKMIDAWTRTLAPLLTTQKSLKH